MRSVSSGGGDENKGPEVEASKVFEETESLLS